MGATGKRLRAEIVDKNLHNVYNFKSGYIVGKSPLFFKLPNSLSQPRKYSLKIYTGIIFSVKLGNIPSIYKLTA